MDYNSNIPESEQIRMNEFADKCCLPGDHAMRRGKRSGEFQHGVVREVGSANPEYILWNKKPPKPKTAGVVQWKESEREFCAGFIAGTRADIMLRLKKSMWAVIEFTVAHQKTTKKKLYTYDILTQIRNGSLVITSKDKLK